MLKMNLFLCRIHNEEKSSVGPETSVYISEDREVETTNRHKKVERFLVTVTV